MTTSVAPTNIALTLSSTGTGVLNKNAPNFNSANFTTILDRFYLPDGSYRFCFAFGSMWNAVHNVTAALGNNTLVFNDVDLAPGDQTLTAPEGIYSYEELWAVFEKQLVALYSIPSPYSETDLPFVLKPNYNTQRIDLYIYDANVIVKFASDSTFYGFSTGNYTGAGSVYSGTSLADVTNGVKSYFISIPELVTGSYVGNSERPYIYAFTPNVAPGSSMDFYPVQREWYYCDITSKAISKLTLQLVDQDGRQLVMAGGNANPVVVKLLFQKIPMGALKNNPVKL